MLLPTQALERTCLSLRERWQRRKPLTERGREGVAASEHPIPLTPFPREGGHVVEGAAHLRARMKPMPLF